MRMFFIQKYHCFAEFNFQRRNGMALISEFTTKKRDLTFL